MEATHRGTSTERILYFDIAKGFAIVTVIVGHAAIRLGGISRAAILVCQFVFSFHMPLFFILSGYFIHAGRQFAWHKEGRRLIVPYLATALVVVVGMTMSYLILHDASPGVRIRELSLAWVNAAMFGAGDVRANTLWPQTVRIGAIWFLLALYWARAIAHAALRTRHAILVGLASFAAGMYTSRVVFLPFSIQPGMCAALFVILGSLARQHDIFRRHTAWYDTVLALAVWFASIVALTPGFMGMATCWFGSTPIQIVLSVVGSCGATYVIVRLSQVVDVHGRHAPALLAGLGQISLTILCVHLIEDNVVRWDAINALLLQGMSPDELLLAESLVRTGADCLIAWALMRVPAIHALMNGKK